MRNFIPLVILLSAFAFAAPPPPEGITTKVNLLRVIDGDTIEVELSVPFTIRMKDCWAPEIRGEQRREGEISSAYLKTLISPGDELTVFIDTTEASNISDVLTFGRVVGKVWGEDKSSSLDEKMIKAGMATREKE